MAPDTVLVLLTLAVGAATFFFGLWWGERGRRLDAYRQVGHRATPVHRPTSVVRPEAPEPMLDPGPEARERLVAEYLEEGFTKEEADAAVTALFQQLNAPPKTIW